jgi:FAD/FMN-containing dehydrogenase
VVSLLEHHGATEVRRAATVEERARLWQGRKKAFGAMGRLSRDLIVQDAVVPRSALPDVLDRIAAIAERHQVTVVNVFHAGDGNLHPNICYDRSDEALAARVRTASREIMAACIEVGGSITGEHGVGSDKLEYMPLIFDDTTLSAMCDVREVFDPTGRANPGKVVPLRACREWRAGGAA